MQIVKALRPSSKHLVIFQFFLFFSFLRFFRSVYLHVSWIVQWMCIAYTKLSVFITYITCLFYWCLRWSEIHMQSNAVYVYEHSKVNLRVSPVWSSHSTRKVKKFYIVNIKYLRNKYIFIQHLLIIIVIITSPRCKWTQKTIFIWFCH